MAVIEPELLDGARAFATAQQLFTGLPTRRLPARVPVGWHGTSIDENEGAFAVVRQGAGLDDLIGERLRLSNVDRAIFVYVIGARGVPADISVARRAFLGLAFLARETYTCTVEVVE